VLLRLCKQNNTAWNLDLGLGLADFVGAKLMCLWENIICPINHVLQILPHVSSLFFLKTEYFSPLLYQCSNAYHLRASSFSDTVAPPHHLTLSHLHITSHHCCNSLASASLSSSQISIGFNIYYSFSSFNSGRRELTVVYR
jgi:hypothetical protein